MWNKLPSAILSVPSEARLKQNLANEVTPQQLNGAWTNEKCLDN